MKKLLIASTALVATAGIAAADVTVSGHAAAGFHSGLNKNELQVSCTTMQLTALAAEALKVSTATLV